MFSFDPFAQQLFSGASMTGDWSRISAIFYSATWLFNPVPFAFLLIVTCLVIARYYNTKEACIFAAASVTAIVATFTIKYLVGAVRPIGHVIVMGSSFPSAHAAISTAYFLMLLHFIKQTPRYNQFKFARIVHYAFCIACPLFVGVSRLYFGVHWLSDVLAGYVIGALVVYCVIRFLEFTPRPRRKKL